MEWQWDEARLADLGALHNMGPCWTKFLPLPSVLTDSQPYHAPEPHSSIHSSPALIPKICWTAVFPLEKTEWTPQAGSEQCPDSATEGSM